MYLSVIVGNAGFPFLGPAKTSESLNGALTNAMRILDEINGSPISKREETLSQLEEAGEAVVVMECGEHYTIALGMIDEQ